MKIKNHHILSQINYLLIIVIIFSLSNVGYSGINSCTLNQISGNDNQKILNFNITPQKKGNQYLQIRINPLVFEQAKNCPISQNTKTDNKSITPMSNGNAGSFYLIDWTQNIKNIQGSCYLNQKIYYSQSFNILFIFQENENQTLSKQFYLKAGIIDQTNISINSYYTDWTYINIYTFTYIPINLTRYQYLPLLLSLNPKYISNQNYSIVYNFNNNSNKKQNMTIENRTAKILLNLNQTQRSNIKNISFSLIIPFSSETNTLNFSLNTIVNNSVKLIESTIKTVQNQILPKQKTEKSPFNVSLDNSNKSLLLRLNEQSELIFTINVNRSNCANNSLCIGLFDQMIVTLSSNRTTNTDQLTFTDSTNITIYNSEGTAVTFNTHSINKTTIILKKLSLSEGTNTVHIASLVGPQSNTSTQITVETRQKVFNQTKVPTTDTITVHSTLLFTSVDSIKLQINELNGSYPSQLHQLQQFSIKITLQSPLSNGDYAIIQIPKEYTLINTTNGNLCLDGSEYQCSFQSNNQVFVKGNFSQTKELTIDIRNNTFLSPKTWQNYSVFEATTYFSYNAVKDAFSRNSTKSDTFYLSCSNISNHCKECNNNSQCISCYNFQYTYLFHNGPSKICLNNCPQGTQPIDYVCKQIKDSSSVTTSFNILPFSAILGLLIFAGISSKFIMKTTLLSLVFTSFAGLCQVLSWFTLTIILLFMDSSYSSSILSQLSKYLMISVLGLNFTLNFINIYFFRQQILTDEQFNRNINSIKNKSTLLFYISNFHIFLSLLFTHKLIQLLFSNFFRINIFSYKLESYNKLNPQNYIRYISSLPSILAITASILHLTTLDSLSINNIVFRFLLDSSCVTFVSLITVLWSTSNRHPDDYICLNDQKNHYINEQISNQPISDIPNQTSQNNNQLMKSKKKSRSPLKSLLNSLKKQQPQLIQQQEPSKNNIILIKPNNEQVNFTEEQMNQKDFDEHSNNLNETRVTSVQQSLQRRAKRIRRTSIQQDIQKRVFNGRIIGPNRSKKGLIKQYLGQTNSQSLKNQVQSKLSPQQLRMAKNLQKAKKILNEIKRIEEKQDLKSSQTNINDLSNMTIEQNINQLLINLNPLIQLNEQILSHIQEIRTANNILLKNNLKVQDFIKYLSIIEEQQENQNEKQNINDNIGSSTPSSTTEQILVKGSRIKSKQFKNKSKKRRSQRVNGPKKFIENQQNQIQPYITDFFENQYQYRDLKECEGGDLDQYQGKLESPYVKESNISMFKTKTIPQLTRTQSYSKEQQNQKQSLRYSQDNTRVKKSKKVNNQRISSIPLVLNIEPDQIPEDSQYFQEDHNIEYLQTNRKGQSSIKTYDIQNQGNIQFSQNVAHCLNEKYNNSNGKTPTKPQIQANIVKSRLICGEKQINQLQGTSPICNLMDRYGQQRYKSGVLQHANNRLKLPSLSHPLSNQIKLQKQRKQRYQQN